MFVACTLRVLQRDQDPEARVAHAEQRGEHDQHDRAQRAALHVGAEGEAGGEHDDRPEDAAHEVGRRAGRR